MDYPRVLHVGFNAIGFPTNTGLTLASMFGAWPQDLLFELYTHSGQSRTAAGTQHPSRPLSTAPSRWFGAGAHGGAASQAGGRRPEQLSPSPGRPSYQDPGPVDRDHAQRRWSRVDGWLMAQGHRAVPATVIHSLLGGVRITKFVAGLAARLDLPVVPHFMDDWMDNLFTDGQLWGLARREAERSLGRVLEHSPRILTIGPDMQSEYAERLHRPADVVGNSADFGLYDELIAQRPSLSEGPLTLRYVGGLHLGRAAALHTVGRALVGQHLGGRPWELALNVPAHDLALADRLADEVDSITNGGNLLPSEVPRTIVNSDALLFLESSDPDITAFTRLSFWTKDPRYLASGRPVLAVGPSDQASIQTLMRTGGAVHGGDGTSEENVRNALPKLNAALEHASAGDRHAAPAMREEFGRSETQARLRRALIRATNS